MIQFYRDSQARRDCKECESFFIVQAEGKDNLFMKHLFWFCIMMGLACPALAQAADEIEIRSLEQRIEQLERQLAEQPAEPRAI